MNYKFNGLERTEEHGLNLDLAFFRSYDSALGRWLQVDPKSMFKFHTPDNQHLAALASKK